MKNKNKLDILLCVFLSIVATHAEFRFCYKGPHRMSGKLIMYKDSCIITSKQNDMERYTCNNYIFTELDCPGGFFAKEKLNLTCKYFARTKNVSTAG